MHGGGVSCSSRGCPKNKFTVDGQTVSLGKNLNRSVYMTADEKYVVKTAIVPVTADPRALGSACGATRAESCTERAILQTMDGLHGASVKARQGGGLGDCAPLTILMDSAGRVPLEHLIGSPVKPQLVARVAARAIRILRAVHWLRFVHGDVHLSNFVFDGKNAASLKIIDFGRAAPSQARTSLSYRGSKSRT
jgi:hypothetical protein